MQYIAIKQCMLGLKIFVLVQVFGGGPSCLRATSVDLQKAILTKRLQTLPNANSKFLNRGA